MLATRSKILNLTLLAALFMVTLCTPPNVQTLPFYSYLNIGPKQLINNTYEYYQGTYPMLRNINTGIITPLWDNIAKYCGNVGTLYFSSTGIAHCFSARATEFISVDINNNWKVMSTYTFNETVEIFFEQQGDAFIVAEEKKNVEGTVWYDLLQSKASCFIPRSFDGIKYIVDGTNLYYFDTGANNKVSLFVYTCADGEKTILNSTINPNDYGTFFLVNNSMAGLVAYFPSGNLPVITAFNRTTFGKPSNLTLLCNIPNCVAKVNDTHFMMAYDINKTNHYVGLFYIDQSLNFVLVQSAEFYNLGYLAIYPQYGNQYYMEIFHPKDVFYSLVFNLTTFQPYNTSLNYYPFQFADGTWVRLHNDTIAIYDSTFSTIVNRYYLTIVNYIYDITGGNYIWGASIDSTNNNQISLVTIDIRASKVTVTPFSTLKCSSSDGFQGIADFVPYGSNDFNLTYRCSEAAYYIYAGKSFSKQIDVSIGSDAANATTYIDYAGGYFYALDAPGLGLGQVTLYTYKTSNGTLLKQTTISLVGVAAKISNDLFAYTSTSLNLSTNIITYSVSQGKNISQINIPMKAVTQIAPLFLNNQTYYACKNLAGSVMVFNSNGEGTSITYNALPGDRMQNIGGNKFVIQAQQNYIDRVYYTYMSGFAVTSSSEEFEEENFLPFKVKAIV